MNAKYRDNWGNIFKDSCKTMVGEKKSYKKYSHNELFHLYVKNLMLFFSDCRAQADEELIDLIESQTDIDTYDADLLISFRKKILSDMKTNPKMDWCSQGDIYRAITKVKYMAC